MGVPSAYGGDPGPPGSGLMMQCGLAEGIGKNLPFAQLYANHMAALQTVVLYGSKMQKDIVCIDGVSGFLTVFGERSEIYSKNGFITGSSFIKAANLAEVKNFLIQVEFEEETRFVLLPKNCPGITIHEKTDEWGTVLVEFSEVEVENDAILPDVSEAGDKITNFEIQDWLEDTFTLLSSASVLGTQISSSPPSVLFTAF